MKYILTSLLLILAFPGVCLAQNTVVKPRPLSMTYVIGANVAVGAATAVIGRINQKKSLPRAAAKGAAAGAMIFAAKWVISRNYPSTNLLGRSLGAVGSSAVLNSARDRPMFEQMAIPYGPVRFHISLDSTVKVRLKIDLAATISTLQALNNDEIKFDGGRSISSGVMTFRADTTGTATEISGMHRASVVVFRPASTRQGVSESEAEKTIAHELVHVVQYDFLFNAVGSPAEDGLAKLIPGAEKVHRFIDIGLHTAIWSAVNAGVPYAKRPWEREAVTFVEH